MSEAGILFALAMMVGVAITLSAVAVLAVLFNRKMTLLFQSRPTLLAWISSATEESARTRRKLPPRLDLT